jgi:hypothetical protein
MQVQNDPPSRWANASVTEDQKAVQCRGACGKGSHEDWVALSQSGLRLIYPENYKLEIIQAESSYAVIVSNAVFWRAI